MHSHPHCQRGHLAPNHSGEVQQAPGTWKPGVGWVPTAVPRDGLAVLNGPPDQTAEVSLAVPTGHTAPPQRTDLRLLVVLHSHGDHVEADDARDEQIQVVAGAHLVDQEAEAGVIRIVGLALCFCSGRRAERRVRSLLCASLQPTHPHLPH